MKVAVLTSGYAERLLRLENGPPLPFICKSNRAHRSMSTLLLRAVRNSLAN